MSSSLLCQKAFPHLFGNILQGVTGLLEEACAQNESLLGLVCGVVHLLEVGAWGHTGVGKKVMAQLVTILFECADRARGRDFIKSFVNDRRLRWAEGSAETSQAAEKWRTLLE
jgi:hypothetical protein